MKKIIFSLSTLFVLVLLFAFTNEKTVEPNLADLNPLKADFVSTTVNPDLAIRFETQFGNVFTDVTRIDVHFNEINDYYYAVYGSDADGKQVFDHFKTTAEEVATESYDYIEMNERTTNSGFRKCREVTTFPFQGNFCETFHKGPICGFVFGPFGCLLF